MTYIFDIDGTICYSSNGDYENSVPIESRIKKVNELYDEGNKIIFNTARGMGRTDNSPMFAERLFRKLTEEQLFLGKPSGDFYIDDKGIKDEDFFNTGN